MRSFNRVCSYNNNTTTISKNFNKLFNSCGEIQQRKSLWKSINVINHRFLSTQNIGPSPPKEGMDWENKGFAFTKIDYMYLSEAERGKPFEKGELKPYGPLTLEPAASVLSYGQGVFEGMKAFRTSKDRVVLFRPKENCKRINYGAERFMMSPIPEEIFIDAVDSFVKANSHWVPPLDGGALYLRPCLFGSGSALGVAPSPKYTFVIYGSPVGSYFKGGKIKPISLVASCLTHRSAPKGVGNVKALGNYAPCFQAQAAAKSEGFSEVLFLDSQEERYVEEAGASNFFCITEDGTVHTPDLRGTILPGITRKSIIQLCQANGMKVVESKLPIDVVMEAKEAFCSGTGASITAVGSITYNGNTKIFNSNKVGRVTQQLYDTLLGIQTERAPDTFHWLHDPWTATTK